MYKSQPTTATSPKIGRSDLMLHIADLADEMKKLARDSDAGLLVTLLGMVQHEAAHQAVMHHVAPHQNLSKVKLTS